MNEAPLSDIRLHQVSIVVRDASMMVRFYREVLGMDLLETGKERHVLGFGQEHPVLELIENTTARNRPPTAPGLFHVAYLYADRARLASALHRVASSGWALQGAADHGVSEALYLGDPEGNGIELYVDRPRAEWPQRDGHLVMYTEALDVEALLATADPKKQETTGTKIGHVHLQVSRLDAAESFWVGSFGLDVIERSFPGALFVSAGGYHHHIGLNTWRSRGQELPEGEWTGLKSMTVIVPDRHELDALQARIGGSKPDSPAQNQATFETTLIHTL